MKKLIVLSLLIASFSCKKDIKTTESQPEKVEESTIRVTDSLLETAIIYEANIRQYSNEGTFKAFTKDIPQLKKLGVKIIWLMPVFPISQTKRKATGGDFASLIQDDVQRNKMLGSYYAVSDFKKINPEFGSIEDFRDLVNEAHKNDVLVILDWVPNHTGWDHIWLKEHPEYYTKNSKGEITDPLNEDGSPVGWADVADLNYENEGLRTEMINDMKFWIQNEGVDGFRCDVAGSVPTSFWKQAIPELRKDKSIFMLAEAWEPELLEDNLFDMAYAWDGHHLLNKLAKGEENALAFDTYIDSVKVKYEPNDILMNFVTNHDENSWNGTIKERMGDLGLAMTTLTYAAPGMPLIYSGQEYGLDKRLLFFEKDSFPKVKGDMWTLLEKLAKVKQHNSALNGGKSPSSYEQILPESKTVLAFKRYTKSDEVIYMVNLGNTSENINLSNSNSYKDVITGRLYKDLKTIELSPKTYMLLEKQ